MLNKINKLSETEFTQVFGNIFENASWIAKKLYNQKPFEDFKDLSGKMIKIFEDTNLEKKMEILNSHPDLADKAKIGSLTQDSNKEHNENAFCGSTRRAEYPRHDGNSYYKPLHS